MKVPVAYATRRGATTAIAERIAQALSSTNSSSCRGCAENGSFFGAYDAEAASIGMMERTTRHLPASRGVLPSGDFRDWESIESWAGEIVAELTATPR